MLAITNSFIQLIQEIVVSGSLTAQGKVFSKEKLFTLNLHEKKTEKKRGQSTHLPTNPEVQCDRKNKQKKKNLFDQNLFPHKESINLY